MNNNTENQNIIIDMAIKLIEKQSFQKKLGLISQFGITRFEKWFQIELACSFSKDDYSHLSEFTWNRELTAKSGVNNSKGKKVIPDYTLKFKNSDEIFYTEIKHIDDYQDCLTKMKADREKYKIKITCIGIFKTSTYRSDINNSIEITLVPIKDTLYSMMYF